jgi:uncharacterized membrane protein (DUF373 family)
MHVLITVGILFVLVLLSVYAALHMTLKYEPLRTYTPHYKKYSLMD